MVFLKPSTSSERLNITSSTNQIRTEKFSFYANIHKDILYAEFVWVKRWALHLSVITWDIKNDEQFKSAFVMLNYFIGRYHALN